MGHRHASRLVPAAGVLAIVAGLWLLAPAFLLAAAPALGLAVALAVGWFPGEHAIARLRGRRPRRRRAPRSTVAVVAAAPGRRASRLLICFSLANRPPPAQRA